MKNILALALLFPLLSFTANAVEKNVENKPRAKNKSEQTKIYRHHENTWTQRDYGYSVELFKCYDSWGHKLRGRFTREEQYLIELGGGSCRKIYRDRGERVDLSKIDHFGFPLHDVYQAINKIKHQYGVRQVKFVEAESVNAGYKTFKYTLVFKTKRQGYREFKVKHNRRTGDIRQIYEV